MVLFNIDNLSLIMMALVGFVAFIIWSFSRRYLKGDRKYKSFFANLIGLISSVFLMVCADHLVLFLIAFGTSNFFLIRLMVHKSEWRAARESGILAFKNFMLGFFFVACAFTILFYLSGQTSIQVLISSHFNSPLGLIALVLLFAGAMTQSGLWPFHKWLLSSLNSPTPVSAIMHAGLINGGGFLMSRFAPLYSNHPQLLSFIFIVGTITAFLGTLWKLMQSDIKRMLACSTMGQMGFMIAQCGLGLFPAGIAHLCWHGLFKAYLFLSSGAVAQEKRLDLSHPPKASLFIIALLSGIGGAFCFGLISDTLTIKDTRLFIVVMAMIAGTQFSLAILSDQTLKKIVIAFLATVLMGGFYGMSLHFIEATLSSLNIMIPQPMNLFHGLSLMLLIISWLTILFRLNHNSSVRVQEWGLRIYVRMLNASQPDPKTVTTHRNHYQY